MLPPFGNSMPFFRGMEIEETIKEKCTLKKLLLKYEFDTLVPDIILTDRPAKDNLYAFKEAFDELRRMEPGDPHGEEIVVDMEVDTDDDGNEIERYLHASNCEGDFWAASLAKEVIIKADITEIRALAQILWHMTFYGFSAEEKTMWDDVPHNRYERKAALLEYRQHCNYARIKCKRHPTEDDLRCALSLDGWISYEKRQAHRNRAKRMRDARQNRSIARLERQGKVTRLIDRLLLYAWDFDFNDVKYLYETKSITSFDFISRTETPQGRVDYIQDNMKAHFNADCLRKYTRFTVVIEWPEQHPLNPDEFTPLANYIRSITAFAERPCRFHVSTTPWSSHDIHLIIICSQ